MATGSVTRTDVTTAVQSEKNGMTKFRFYLPFYVLPTIHRSTVSRRLGGARCLNCML